MDTNRYYLCIDLKSFFASVECVERGLDSLKTRLVVADPSRGQGALCLAVSPALKALGVRNRCRVSEIPKNIDYICALPRMKHYINKSADIYAIYLRYISKDDIYVYSIDEVFMDITTYIDLYGLAPKQLAKKLIDAVYNETGICATAGIGTNMFLAKIAMDITAKHSDDHMGYLNEELFKETLWHHKPLTDFWNVGAGIARRLLKYGIDDMYGIAHMNEKILYKEFGVNAEYLIDHSKGIEPCTIKECKEYQPTNHSISNSQILFEDYKYEDALLVVKEMVELNVLQLVEKGLVTNLVSLGIGYSDNTIRPTGGSLNLGMYTNSYKELNECIVRLFYKTTDKNHTIRRIGIGFGNVVSEEYRSYTLFTDEEALKKEENIQKAIIGIKNKFGKNAILKGMNLEAKATTRKRNTLIGGHNGE